MGQEIAHMCRKASTSVTPQLESTMVLTSVGSGARTQPFVCSRGCTLRRRTLSQPSLHKVASTAAPQLVDGNEESIDNSHSRAFNAWIQTLREGRLWSQEERNAASSAVEEEKPIGLWTQRGSAVKITEPEHVDRIMAAQGTAQAAVDTFLVLYEEESPACAAIEPMVRTWRCCPGFRAPLPLLMHM